MDKQDIVSHVSEETGISKQIVEKVVYSVVKYLKSRTDNSATPAAKEEGKAEADSDEARGSDDNQSLLSDTSLEP